jgi:hypothetical protein
VTPEGQQLLEDMRDWAAKESSAGRRAVITRWCTRLALLLAEAPRCRCGSRREEHGADGIWHEYQPHTTAEDPVRESPIANATPAPVTPTPQDSKVLRVERVPVSEETRRAIAENLRIGRERK